MNRLNYFSVAKTQNGFSVVLALFILVVMSLLGAAMMNLLSQGSESVAREVISARALMAANSGIDRNLSEIFPPGSVTDPAQCAVSASTNLSTPTTGSSTYTMGGLFGCGDVVVSCYYLTVNSINYFTLTSTSSCGPTGDEAIRVVEVQAGDI